MKAARFPGNQAVELLTVPDPAPGPGEVVVRVAYCAACGSDNRPLRDGLAVTPGHEISGTVVQLGPGVESAWLDQRVAVYIPLFCGQCDACRRGYTQFCPHLAGLIGWQRDGGYADAVVVPARNLIWVPPDVGLDEAVLLLDILGTTGHSLRTASRVVTPASARVLILGLGPLGFGAAVMAQALGFAPPFIYDPAPARQELARVLGAHVWHPDNDDGFDLVIEASGRAEARAQALLKVASGGVLAALGESNDPWTVTPSVPLRRKDFFVLRTFYFPLTEVSANIAALRLTRSTLAPLLDVRRPLGELEDTLSRFGRGEWLKPLTGPG